MPRPVLEAEIASRADHSLPVGQADAAPRPDPWVSRRHRGGGHALTSTRPALLPHSPATGALTSNDPSKACAPAWTWRMRPAMVRVGLLAKETLNAPPDALDGVVVGAVTCAVQQQPHARVRA
jgi:hypothetical protein